MIEQQIRETTELIDKMEGMIREARDLLAEARSILNGNYVLCSSCRQVVRAPVPGDSICSCGEPLAEAKEVL